MGTDGGGNYLQFGPLLGSGAVEGLYAYLRTGFIVSLKKQPTEPIVIVMVSCWILVFQSCIQIDITYTRTPMNSFMKCQQHHFIRDNG